MHQYFNASHLLPEFIYLYIYLLICLFSSVAHISFVAGSTHAILHALFCIIHEVSTVGL